MNQNRVLVLFSDELLSELDEARHEAPRSAWIRRAVEERLQRDKTCALLASPRSQPLKRGEVVWHVEDDEGKADGLAYLVVNDETYGNVDVVSCRTLEGLGQERAELYERRSDGRGGNGVHS